MDNDGDLDLFLARAGGNRLFINNGSGVFADQAAARGVQDGAVGCHAVAFGDVDGDGDGDVDLFLGRDLGNAPRLYLNNGSGFFTDNALAAGITGATSARSAVFGDIDNDGDLDLIAAGGEIGGGSYVNLLFRNDGGNVFTEVAAVEGVQDIATEHRGAIFLDLDNDGDLDLFVGRKTPADGNKDRIYRNVTGGTAWLKVRATGVASNRSAIGTKIWVYAAGHLGDPAWLRGFRQISAGSGQASCPPAEQHFGLGATVSVDVRVRFPSGLLEEQTGVSAGQTLSILEPPTPIVTLVDSTAPAGTYIAGDVVPVTVRFSGSVVVTGTPQLTLETGVVDAVVDYAGGSGTNTLTFNYTVATGHRSLAVDVASTTALALNGGTIGTAGGVPADLTLPAPGGTGSLSAQRTLVIGLIVERVDSTAPAGTYGPGALIPVTVRFTQAVVVTGTPQLTLETGSVDAVVDYAGGSGTNTLTFEYTVASGHQTPALDVVSTTALALNGGGIGTAGGVPADLTLPVPGGAGSLSAQRILVINPAWRDIQLDAGACGALGLEFLLLLVPLAWIRSGRPLRSSALALVLLLGASALAQDTPPANPPTKDVPPAKGQEPGKKADPGVLPDDGQPQEPPPEEPARIDVIVTLRGGGLSLPEFDAATTFGRRAIDAGVLWDAGLDLGLNFGGFLIFATAEAARSSDLAVRIGGLHAGVEWDLLHDEASAPLLQLQVSAGVLYGMLEADGSGFGDFESGLGGQARAALSMRVASGIDVGVWADLRHLRFDFEEDVLSGDDSAGGLLPAAGLSIGVRF